MANQLTKDLEILFETVIDSFEASNVVSRECGKFRPGDTAMQRAGDVVYRPQGYHLKTVSGLDLTAASVNGLVQRQVPARFREPENVIYELDAREMRDPWHKEQAGKAAGRQLSAFIDNIIVDEVAARATNVSTIGAAVTGTALGTALWDSSAIIDATMLSIGVPQGGDRKAFYNPFNYKDLAKELGGRAYAHGATLTAYEKRRSRPSPALIASALTMPEQSRRVPLQLSRWTVSLRIKLQQWTSTARQQTTVRMLLPCLPQD